VLLIINEMLTVKPVYCKGAAMIANFIESYKKVLKSVVMSEISEISVDKWQREWELTAKGEITKEYFPCGC
jgi:hypothetical protein